MKRKTPGKPVTLEQLYPDARGRRAGDAVLDALPMTATLAEACDAYDEAYFEVTGKSPWRRP